LLRSDEVELSESEVEGTEEMEMLEIGKMRKGG